MTTSRSPQALLRSLFAKSGYVRAHDPARYEEIGTRYHKGWEVRLVVSTRKELADVRRLLRRAGFRPGKPYPKHGMLVQPVYGREPVEWFTR